MNSIIRNLTIILFAAIFLTVSCFSENDDLGHIPVTKNPTNTESADDQITESDTPDVDTNNDEDIMRTGPEDTKIIISDIINEIFGNINNIGGLGLTDLIAGLTNMISSFRDGLTVEMDISDNLQSLLLTVTFEDCEKNSHNIIINGIMPFQITGGISEKAMILNVKTDVENPLIITGKKIEDTTIEIEDLTVMYEFLTLKCSFTGKVIINDDEYEFTDFPSPVNVMNILAKMIKFVPWDLIQDRLNLILLKNTSKFDILSKTIYTDDTLQIVAGLNVDTRDPGVILDFTFTEFKISNASIYNKLNGSMNVLVTYESIADLKLKLIFNTDEDTPLVIPGPWLLPDQTIGLEDVTLYYSIIEGNFVNDPEPSGTIILDGVPITVNSYWVSFLISLVAVLL